MTEIFENQLRKSYSAYNDERYTKNLKDNLSDEKNEEFYNKLVQLKNEQKKTLEYMHELYNQKQILKQEIRKSENNLNDLMNTDKNFNPNSHNFDRNTVSAYENNTRSVYFEDTLNNNHKNENHFEDNNNNNINTNGYHDHHNFKSSADIDTCHICANHDSHKYNEDYNYRNSFSDSLKSDQLKSSLVVNSKPPLPVRSSYSNEKSVDHTQLNEELNDNLRRIEKIWENFDLDQYDKQVRENETVKKTKRSSFKESHKLQNENEWVPKVTIPEPFKMTIRDQIKSANKIRVEKEIEEERQRKLEEELKELEKQFKANPVPANIFLPLYEEKKREEEMRKQRLRELRKEFMSRVRMSVSFPEQPRRHSFSGEADEQFKANPLPEFYYHNDNITEKMKEDELYRLIKTQVRAHEMLKESKLPRNMAMQKDRRKLELHMKERDAQRNSKQSSSTKSSTKLRKSTEIPNYDALYKKFTTELEEKKSTGRRVTTCKPFTLQTKERAKIKSITKRPSSATDTRSNLNLHSIDVVNEIDKRLSRFLSTSMDTLPIQNTETHKLRQSVTKNKINEIARNELRKEHIEKMKKIKTKNLHEQMERRLKNPNVKDVNENIQRKTRELKLQGRLNDERFDDNLKEISKKVESRKFLFEQVDEENARRAAEKRFKETLKSVGLTEDMLNEASKKEGKVAKSVSKHYGIDDDWIHE